MMVSVAMATYNGEKYLTEQIESILNQTIKDIELVICDDCSTDATMAILQSYAQKDGRIKIYGNEKNIGYLKNFERVISLTKGEYIALSDQDDIWSTNHLEVLLNNISESVLSCGNVSISTEQCVDTGRTWGEMHYTKEMPSDNLDKLMSLIYYRGCYQGASMLFKRELVDKILPFPRNISYHDFWISCVACLFGGIRYTDESIARYRIHGSNLSGSHNIKLFRWYFFKKLCRHGMNGDRIYYIEALRELPVNDKKAINIIKTMEKFYKRRRTYWGFLLNIVYVLRNTRKIFCI